MNNGIIIQARMGSSRLPGKVMRDFNGKTLLGQILFRLKKKSNNALIVIATSTFEQDNIIEDFCRENSVECFRGSEQNVLERYFMCAQKYQFDNIVRMTADNPFPDIEELDNLIDFHEKNGYDFSECLTQLPIGVGMEIFTYACLEDDMKNSSQSHHFEHVDEYVLENKRKYKYGIMPVSKEKCYPHISLTVDTLDDYKKACFILKQANGEYVTTEEAVKLCMLYV